jgi:predicted membrane-bound mannosyltransferase
VRLVGGYTLVLTLIYTVIPYKTPWCVIGFLHGWILLAGVGVLELWSLGRRWWGRAAVAVVVAVGSLHLAWQAYQASYVHADSQRNPFVYAHTLDTLLELVERVDALMRLSPAGYDTVVQVMAKGGDYWPLPWYLRRCRNVGWYDRVPPDAVAPVMVASPDFAPALRERLGERFEELGYFGLRPAVFLQLHVERNLWAAYLRSTARE